MTKKDFIKTISYFLQDPDEIVSDRGSLMFCNGDAEYSITLEMCDGEVRTVVDDRSGVSYSPVDWITVCLVHLERLADAILRHYRQPMSENKYVRIVSQERVFPDEEPRQIDDTEKLLYEKLDGDDVCQTSVYFVTSEAGDGKTVLMRKLAVRSALAYRDGKQNWLFVPIELGGLPFFRLDEFVLGTLNRHYRYSLFLEGFYELVRRGRIVLGLDGFEESAVQGADGDVISSLGNLLKALDSQGKVVFASRRAFYFHSHLHDYKTFSGPASQCDVCIEELRLCSWGRTQIVEQTMLCGLDECQSSEFADYLISALGADCPLLVRAVLANRFLLGLLDGSVDKTSINNAIERFQGQRAEAIIHLFVSYLIDRETTKLVRSNTDVTPILTSEQHARVLSLLAEEMWKTDAEQLSQVTAQAVLEMVIEDFKLNPDEYNRCCSHFPHHAFLTLSRNDKLSFCHIDFYLYFLGVSIADLFSHETLNQTEIRRFFDRKPLPVLAIKECVRRIRVSGRLQRLRNELHGLVRSTQLGTPLGLNLTAILIMLHDGSAEELKLDGVYCPEFVMRKAYLNHVTLVRSYIEKCDLSLIGGCTLKLIDCDFPRAEFVKEESLCGLSFDVASLPKVLVRSTSGERPDVGDVSVVCTLLRRAGAEVRAVASDNEAQEFTEDDRTRVFFKVILTLDSRTVVSENVLKSRLGMRYYLYENEVAPYMRDLGILKEESSRGRVVQSVYRLQVPEELLYAARLKARGCFDSLIGVLKKELM